LAGNAIELTERRRFRGRRLKVRTKLRHQARLAGRDRGMTGEQPPDSGGGCIGIDVHGND
jgi:hypothetical protein